MPLTDHGTLPEAWRQAKKIWRDPVLTVDGPTLRMYSRDLRDRHGRWYLLGMIVEVPEG
ncbi:hypothetical protein PBI_SMEAGOL_80 [Mycobacterium phage Smeagol]|nr:hypothetical protein PBI_SMEAGOL_80 [Mycobacterium phage Smeagol]